jgi:hypothetical protein
MNEQQKLEQKQLEQLTDFFNQAVNSYSMTNPEEFDTQKHYDELRKILEPEEEESDKN